MGLYLSINLRLQNLTNITVQTMMKVFQNDKMINDQCETRFG